ncbi:MAG: hypothetical protein ACHQUB_01320 [Candidatus Saccharimonadia bacterium]
MDESPGQQTNEPQVQPGQVVQPQPLYPNQVPDMQNSQPQFSPPSELSQELNNPQSEETDQTLPETGTNESDYSTNNEDSLATPDDSSEEDGDSEAGENASFSWQASEFIHHQKQGLWYFGFAVVALLLIGIALITKQWFSAAVFVAMAFALLVYAKKEPRVLNYMIDDGGISVENKLYRYEQFRSFSVFNDVAWHSIDLDPTQRFQPRLTIIFESKDLDSILGILSQNLPRADRLPDLVERATRIIKF